MSGSEQEREHELAELLREVRALRETIDQLKADRVIQPSLPPDYAVAVRTRPELPPDYAVAVRARPQLPPEYAVAVRTRPELPPDYAVLVRPSIPRVEDPLVTDE